MPDYRGQTGGAGVGSAAGGFVGGIANLAGAGGKGGDDYYKRALEAILGIQTPNYDFSQITPEQLQMRGNYSAETYDPMIQGQPQMINEDPSLRRTQMGALDQLQREGQGQLSIVDQIANQQAQQATAGQATQSRDAALEELAMRGMTGGGAASQLFAAAGQQGADAAGAFGANLARDSALRRLSLQGQTGEMAGNIRGQDFQAGAANSDVINRFNQWVSQLGTGARRDNAQARQGASDKNTSERQRIGDTNQINRQNTDTSNLERKNRLLNQGFNDEMAKGQAAAGQYSNYGRYLDTEKAAREKNISGIASAGGGIAGYGFGG